MKKIALFLLASVGLSAQLKFTADIKNAPEKQLMIANQAGFNKIINQGADGKFTETLTLKEGFYMIRIKEQVAQLFLSDKGNFSLTNDYNDFDKTLKYKGTFAKENDFLLKMSTEQDPTIFSKVQEAQTLEDLDKELNAAKEKFVAKVPKELSDSFKKNFTEMMGLQFGQMKEYFAGEIGLKKLNGSQSPLFDYENHKGGKTKLDELKGKYVYVDVWATWCGPCRQEIPSLQQVEKDFHDKNIHFVSVSIDKLENKDKWNKFVTEKSLGGIQLLADKDWSSDFVKGYQISGIPRFILIGPDGKIVDANAPRPSDPKLREKLSSLLKP